MSQDGGDARVFSRPRRVHFGDCDPAAIVFYPRYFEMLNALVEDWWRDMGLPWTELAGQRGLATPVSHLETHFLRPSAMGDALMLSLRVEAVGRSSLRLDLRVDGAGGDARLHARQRMVCVTQGGREPRAWPEDVRAMLRQWLPPAGA